MNYELIQNAEKYSRRNRRKKLWQKIAGVLGCAVVFCTTYALIIPAITMEKETICGYEEHTHSEECYVADAGMEPVCSEDSLGIHRHSGCSEDSCGYADFVVHTHDSTCYDDVGNLWCPLPEIKEHYHSDSCYEVTIIPAEVHYHSDSCYIDVRGELVCTEPLEVAHEHGDSCYVSSTSLNCDIPETDGHAHTEACMDAEGNLVCELQEQEAHQHDDACYVTNTELNCDKTVETVHSHGDGCYAWNRELICGQEESDPSEAVDQEIWELVCGKEEIILHQHSGACESGCGQPEIRAHYHSDSCFRAYDNGMVLACGMEEHTHEAACVASTEEEVTEDVTETEAIVDASSPEENENADATAESDEADADDLAADQETETTEVHETVADENGSDTSAEEGDTSVENAEESVECTLDPDGEEEETANVEETTETLAAEQTEESTISISGTLVEILQEEPVVGSSKSTEVEKSFPSASISGAGTVYDPVTDTYTSDLTLTFEFAGKQVMDIGDNDVYVYTYPASIEIPSDLLDDGEIHLYDSNNEYAGTYEFVGNADDSHTVKIRLDPNYVVMAKSSEVPSIKGYVNFDGTMDGSLGNNNSGSLNIVEKGFNLNIPYESITESADINVTKTAQHSESDGKIYYTIYVQSKDGTPDPINLTDILSANGVTIGTPDNVKVEKGQISYNTWGTQYGNQWSDFTGSCTINGSDNNLTMTLPALEPGTSQGYGVVLGNAYKITYAYDISAMPSGSHHLNNTVNVEADDDTNKQKVEHSATAETDVDRTVNISKNGEVQNGKIKWTITVNSKKVDIAGSELTDDMFANIEGEVTIEPASGVERVESDGKLSGLKFTQVNGGANTSSYTVTYYTDIPADWNQQEFKNKATIDPTPDQPDNDDEKETEKTVWSSGGSVNKTSANHNLDENGNVLIPWTVTITPPSGGIPSGTVIQDTLGENQWFTPEQIAAWNGTINGASSNQFEIVITDTNGCSYTLAEAMAADASVKFTGITITTNSEIPANGNLSFTVNSTADGSVQNQGNINYTNKVTVNDGDGTPSEDNETHSYDKGSYGIVKTHDYIVAGADGKTGTVNWTITVSVPPDGLTAQHPITDTMGEGVTITKDQILANAWTLTWNDNAQVDITGLLTFYADGVSYTYAQIQSGENVPEAYNKIVITPTEALKGQTPFKIVIPTTVDISFVEGNKTFTNTASIPEHESTDYVSYDKGNLTLSKRLDNAVITDGKAAVKWTVDVAVPSTGLPAGTVITDTLSNADGAHYITKAQIDAWDGKLSWTDSSQVNDITVTFFTDDNRQYVYMGTNEGDFTDAKFTSFQIKLNSGAMKPNNWTGQFWFSIETTADLISVPMGQNNYKNTVSIGNVSRDATYPYNKNLTVNKSAVGSVTPDANGIAPLEWKVELSVPEGGIPAGTVITDTLQNPNHYFTWQQICDWNGQLTWDNNTVVDAQYYSVQFAVGDQYYNWSDLKNTADENLKNAQFTGMKITLNQPVNKQGNGKLSFGLMSTADVSNASTGNTTYVNKVKVNDGNEVSAEHKYSKGGVVKMDGNSNTGTTSATSSDGKITWIVKVTTDGNTANRLTMTDTLPEGVVPESVQVYYYPQVTLQISNGQLSGSANGYTFTGSYQNNVLTVEMSGNIEAGKDYYYKIVCNAEDILKDGQMHSLTNTATAETEKSNLGESSQTQEWTYEKVNVQYGEVDKTGKWDNTNRKLLFNVIINPEGEDWLADGDYLSFKDVFEHQTIGNRWYPSPAQFNLEMMLIPNSVTLKYAERNSDGALVPGELVSGWKWTHEIADSYSYNTHLHIIKGSNIPDGEALILQYTYQVTSDAGPKDSFQFGYTNTFTVEGANKQDNTQNWNEEWKESSSSAGIITSTESLTLYKVDKENNGLGLPGAVFTVYEVNDDLTEGAKKYDYQTNDSGILQIVWGKQGYAYEYNKLYVVYETEAPTGYVLPEYPHKMYFYFSNEEDTTNTLPATIPGDAYDLSKQAHVVQAENQKSEEEVTEIVVKKVWKDQNNAPVDPGAEQIQVTLLRWTEGSNEPEFISPEGVLSADNDWQYRFKNLPVKSENDEAYTYSVMEITQVPGFSTSYSNNTPITEGSITIVNTQVPDSTSLSVTKRWVDDKDVEIDPEAESIQVKLQRSVGETLDETYTGEEVTLNAANLWSYTFNNLPISSEDGNTYTYSVLEITQLEGFEVSYENSNGTVTITNKKLPATVDIPVEKIWKDVDGSVITTYTGEIQIQLQRKTGEDAEPENVGDPITLSTTNTWKHTFENLPEKSDDGKTYIYSVMELTEVPNFSATYETAEDGTLQVINTAEGYTLPETGGTGTELYTAGGLAMMIAAAVLLLCNQIKRRRGDFASP